MQTPTSGVAPDEDDELLTPLDDDELLQPPVEDVVEPQSPDDDEELLHPPVDDDVDPLLDELDEVCPQSTHGTPLIPTSPPCTRATQTRPGLHLCSALHS
jgi:hypothetical protein